MKTLKVLTIVVITGLVGATAAHAAPACKENDKICQKRKDNRAVMKEIFQELNLTVEQTNVMKENRKEMRAQMREKRLQRDRKREMDNMSEFVSANGFDKEAFIANAMQKAQNRIEFRANRFEKTMNILTPDQRIKFVSLLQEKQK